MGKVSDYRVPQARAHRLHAESLRLQAEATRLHADFHIGPEHRASMYISAASSEATAETYDRLASELEAEMASDGRQVTA